MQPGAGGVKGPALIVPLPFWVLWGRAIADDRGGMTQREYGRAAKSATEAFPIYAVIVDICSASAVSAIYPMKITTPNVSWEVF